jgi:signal transduction histidine kinase
VESRRQSCLLRQGGAVLDEDKPFMIFGERLLCYTLFANLLNNAIEASSPAGAVTIDLEETGASWRVAIHNDGEVPQEIRGRFFEKYVTCGKSHGTGLGTYSALMVARAHGGSIHMTTGAREGTTLTVELPKPAAA